MDPSFTQLLDNTLKTNPSDALKNEDIYRCLYETYGTNDWPNIQLILKKHGQIRNVQRKIIKDRKEQYQLTVISQLEDEITPLINEILKDSPAHGMACVPHGYKMWDYKPGTNACIIKMIPKVDAMGEVTAFEVPICSIPIIITERLLPVDNDTCYIKLAYKQRYEWCELVVPQHKVFNSQHIVDTLASRGLPITSNNKGDIIDYLQAYMARNEENITTTHITHQMGWIGTHNNPTQYGFMCGEKFLLNHKTNRKEQKRILFLAQSPGDASRAKHIETYGTFDGWYKSLNGLDNYPRVEFGLYASFASVLLAPLKVPGFVVDWSSTTAKGKTTALIVAASVWGLGAKPNKKESLIEVWESTRVGIESKAYLSGSLPILMDDTKHAQEYAGKTFISKMVYTICSGRGKLRGTKTGGTDISKTWCAVLLSNGESLITDFDKAEGAATRALCIWGFPFNAESKKEAAYVDALEKNLDQNYGHAGPAFVEWVISQKEYWKIWRENLAQISNEYAEVIAEEYGYGIASRLANSLAVVEMAGRLVHLSLKLPWKYNSPIKRQVLQDVIANAGRADQSIDALRDIKSFCYKNIKHFEGTKYETSGPILGRWEMSATVDDWDRIAILSGVAREELDRLGYDVNGVLKAWKKAGFTDCDDSHTTKRVSLLRTQMHCVVLLRSGLEALNI